MKKRARNWYVAEDAKSGEVIVDHSGIVVGTSISQAKDRANSTTNPATGKHYRRGEFDVVRYERKG